MNFSIKTIKLRNLIIVNSLTIILNLLCIAIGILYILQPQYALYWDFFGVIMSITIFENLFFIYFSLHKKNILRAKSRKIGYGFLLIIILSILFMMLGNLLLSVIYSNELKSNFIAYLLTYGGYFGIFIYGLSFASFNIRILNHTDLLLLKYTYSITSENSTKAKIILRKVLVFVSRTTFLIGIIFAIVTIFGSFEIVTTIIAILSGQFGLFFSLIFLANTILLLKLKRRKRTTKKYYRTAVIGLFVSGCLLMPIFLTNSTVNNADRAFTTGFGNNWRDKIPHEVDQYFLETPFSLTEYYLGVQPKDCIIEKNILFYNDEGIELYFDAYMPLNRNVELPGENSTIIRIHGGAWVSGDKGLMNMMQMNKYFAAQGYIVFDIQYGLDSNPLFDLDPLTPNYQKGNFMIDDMMHHIGAFTNYLASHVDDYGANLDSVFVSGGSAGGQLASAVGLAIASGNYSHIFNANLTVKGIIPFYPANGAMNFFGIGGSSEFKNPELLINKSSPPCLIFQGTHDILNYFGISETMRDTYLAKGNHECAILWMPLAGHASDIYFSSQYNQVFLYYMERFLYLYH